MRAATVVSRRGSLWAACLVAVIIGALGIWAQNASLVGVNYDDGVYALLAKSVAEDAGYRLTYLPEPVPGVKYPPIYPLSLAPFWMLWGSEAGALRAMKIANGVYMGLAAGMFLLLLLGRRLLAFPLGFAVTVLGFVAGSMMLVTTGVLSEPLYLLLLFSTLWAADGLGEDAPIRQAALVGGLAAVVALTRMVGLTAVAAVLVALWWRAGARKAVIAAAAAAAVLAPWIVFVLAAAPQVPDVLVPHYGSYLQLYLANVAGSPATAVHIVLTNFGANLQTLGAKLLPAPLAPLRSLAGIVFLGLAALGARNCFRRAPATATYPWLYLGVISVWSFPPFRFVFILFPLLLALAVASVDWKDSGAPLPQTRPALDRLARFGKPAALVLAILWLGQFGYREWRSIARRVWDSAQLNKSAVSQEVIAWALSNTDTTAVFAYEFDPMIALHAGRRSVPNNYEAVHAWYRQGPAPVDPLARLLQGMDVDYLAVRRNIPAAAEPIDALAGRYPGALELQHITPRGAFIFWINGERLPAAAEREPEGGITQDEGLPAH